MDAYIMDSEAVKPSTCTEANWIYASNEEHPDYEPEFVGKWMIFRFRDEIDSVWKQISAAVQQGRLGTAAKVSTAHESG